MKFNKHSIAIAFIIFFGLSFSGANTAHAVVAVGDLGAAANYSVWGATGITGGAAVTAWGSAGENNTGVDDSLAPNMGGNYPTGTYHQEDQSATVGTAITAQRLALDGAIATGTVDLASANVAVGPGVYDVSTTAFTKTLTLNGAGVYIFRRLSSNIAQSSVGTMVLNGACASDIYWDVGTDMAFATGAGLSMYGTIIAGTTIAFNGSTGLTFRGRALTDTQVTLGGFTINITQPVTCSTPSASAGGNMPRFVPLINIVKVPTPLALPTGPGPVTYDYTVTNPSIQALSDITVTDDMCTPVTFVSGDLNNDKRLDVNESWKYSCTTTLAATTTNTAIATGYGDGGQSAIATAIATVVVGAPTLPPIINVVKVPSRLTPFPFGGGAVTYTYKVTNPGVVGMSNISVTDDKCAPVNRSDSGTGDLNHNNLLDHGETWTYTCNMNVTTSTRNVATAKGTANGFTALGYAFANVFVAAPGLPNTGLAPVSWSGVLLGAIVMLGLVSLLAVLKKKTK